MKTFAALIRRYVLATAAIVLLVGGLLVGQIFYVGFKSNTGCLLWRNRLEPAGSITST